MQYKINQFWEWFVQHEQEFREVEDANRVVEMLNNQVLDFGLFSWQIGEGNVKPHHFTISPNGDKIRLRLSKQIMAKAPNLEHWEFYPSKPPKLNWDYHFEAFDRSLIKQSFNTQNWEVVLRSNSSEKLQIIIFAENILQLDEDDLPMVADLVVTNLIGEEMKIHFVESIHFVDDFEAHEEDRVFKLAELRDRLSLFL